MMMTFGEALRIADALRPNMVDAEIKTRWLTELEGRILTEIVGKSPEGIFPLAGKTPPVARLSAPAPYDRLYWTYLVAMADLAAADMSAYQASEALFREAYDAYASWYQRTKGGRM